MASRPYPSIPMSYSHLTTSHSSVCLCCSPLCAISERNSPDTPFPFLVPLSGILFKLYLYLKPQNRSLQEISCIIKSTVLPTLQFFIYVFFSRWFGYGVICLLMPMFIVWLTVASFIVFQVKCIQPVSKKGNGFYKLNYYHVRIKPFNKIVEFQ